MSASEDPRGWLRLGTATISDALDRLGIAGQCAGIRPLESTMAVVGSAFTVRYGPCGTEPGTVGDYLDDVPPGAVVTLDNSGRTDATVWGGILTEIAAARGVAGTVVDGICRDTAVARGMGYPLFARGSWMRTGKDRVQVEGVGVPVSIGGVRVCPGDVLIGDVDGLLAIPADSAQAVLDTAREIARAEAAVLERVRGGASLAKARAEASYHQLQRRQLGDE